MNIQALKEKRSSLVASARQILDNAVNAGRSALSADELKAYDAFMAELEAVKATLERAERVQDEDRANSELQPRRTVTGPVTGRVGFSSAVTTTGSQFVADVRDGQLFGIEARAIGGASSPGSYIVPDDYRPAFFDRLAAESVGLRAGFTVIPTTSDTLRVPHVSADPSAAWTSEAGTITPSDPTYDEILATPRKLAGLTQMSNELISDSNPKVLALLEMQMTRALALKLDLGFFEGSGTAPEIRGLKNVAGIQTVSMGTNGAAFTNLDPFADAIGALEQQNARATAIVMHPRSWKALLKLKEQTASNNKPLLQESAGSAGARVERRIYGVPVLLSSQLSITEVQGTSGSVCSSAYVLQADGSVAVFRQDVRVEVDRSRLFNTDQSELRAILRADLVVPNPMSVCRVVGIL